jgi:hypothetical protein
VEGALNAIKDGLKVKESTSLSLTGIKDKPEKKISNNDGLEPIRIRSHHWF